MDTTQRKTEAINLRMSPAVKALLRAAADQQHRTLSNMLEVLILEHCRRNSIDAASSDGATAVRRPGALAKARHAMVSKR